MASPLRRIDSATRYVRVIDETDTQQGDSRFDDSSGAPIDYIGTAVDHKSATDAGDLWKIFKFTFSGTTLTRIEQLDGNWDDRTTMAWS